MKKIKEDADKFSEEQDVDKLNRTKKTKKDVDKLIRVKTITQEVKNLNLKVFNQNALLSLVYMPPKI